MVALEARLSNLLSGIRYALKADVGLVLQGGDRGSGTGTYGRRRPAVAARWTEEDAICITPRLAWRPRRRSATKDLVRAQARVIQMASAIVVPMTIPGANPGCSLEAAPGTSATCPRSMRRQRHCSRHSSSSTCGAISIYMRMSIEAHNCLAQAVRADPKWSCPTWAFAPRDMGSASGMSFAHGLNVVNGIVCVVNDSAGWDPSDPAASPAAGFGRRAAV